MSESCLTEQEVVVESAREVQSGAGEVKATGQQCRPGNLSPKTRARGQWPDREEPREAGGQGGGRPCALFLLSGSFLVAFVLFQVYHKLCFFLINDYLTFLPPIYISLSMSNKKGSLEYFYFLYFSIFQILLKLTKVFISDDL